MDDPPLPLHRANCVADPMRGRKGRQVPGVRPKFRRFAATACTQGPGKGIARVLTALSQNDSVCSAGSWKGDRRPILMVPSPCVKPFTCLPQGDRSALTSWLNTSKAGQDDSIIGRIRTTPCQAEVYILPESFPATLLSPEVDSRSEKMGCDISVFCVKIRATGHCTRTRVVVCCFRDGPISFRASRHQARNLA